MYRFVADHNDEQVIAMFKSPWEILMLTWYTFVVESNIIFSYFQAIKITLLTKCLTILSNATS